MGCYAVHFFFKKKKLFHTSLCYRQPSTMVCSRLPKGIIDKRGGGVKDKAPFFPLEWGGGCYGALLPAMRTPISVWNHIVCHESSPLHPHHSGRYRLGIAGGHMARGKASTAWGASNAQYSSDHMDWSSTLLESNYYPANLPPIKVEGSFRRQN
jgi:hypothetical protein